MFRESGFETGKNLFDVIIEYVAEALKPFYSKSIEVSITGERPGIAPVVEVRLSLYPDNPCVINDYRLWLYNRGTTFLYSEIAFRAKQHFASIPALPVGDHITLGEN